MHTLQTGWCYYAGMDAAENTAIPLTAQLCVLRARAPREAAVHTLQTGWCYYAGLDAAENTAIPLTAQLCAARGHGRGRQSP